MSKKNIFIKKISNLLLSINNKIESFFNFLQQLRFNKKKFLDKKIFISSAVLVFSIFVYLILPKFYDKNEVKNQIKDKIFQDYNIKINFINDPKYGLFPKPHFLIDNVEIEYNSKSYQIQKKLNFTHQLKIISSLMTLNLMI